MTALPVMLPRHRPLGRADHAALVLLREVRAESWQAEDAARELLVRLGHDRLLLQLLRARVARRLLGRHSRYDLRASATLAVALELLGGDAVVPSQRQAGSHAL